MSILYAGNLANVGYYHVQNFRKHNFDMDLVMENNPPLLSEPRLRNPSLNKYPDWIRTFDKNSLTWKTNLLKIMRDKKYELIHAHAEYPIFAYSSRRPFISQIMGSDLTEMAFSNSLRGILLRRAYRKSKLVLFSTPGDLEKLSRLKVTKSLFLPLLFDIDDVFFPKTIEENPYNSDFIIFHPTSHIWDVKGNDILIRGFHQFLQNNPKSLLIAVKIGPDIKKSQKLVTTLGIDNHVKFLEHLDASKLQYFYNLSDVVADQFILNGIGGIGIETFTCAKPLITSCSSTCYDDMYPVPPPALNATTPNEISEILELLKDNTTRQDIGKRSKDWVKRFQSPEIIFNQSKLVYELVLNNIDVSEIKSQINKLTNH